MSANLWDAFIDMGFYFIDNSKYSLMSRAITELVDMTDSDFFTSVDEVLQSLNGKLSMKNSKLMEIFLKIKNYNLLFLLLTIHKDLAEKLNKQVAYVISNGKVSLKLPMISKLIEDKFCVKNIEICSVVLEDFNGDFCEVLYNKKICRIGKNQVKNDLKKHLLSAI